MDKNDIVEAATDLAETSSNNTAKVGAFAAFVVGAAVVCVLIWKKRPVEPSADTVAKVIDTTAS